MDLEVKKPRDQTKTFEDIKVQALLDEKFSLNASITCLKIKCWWIVLDGVYNDEV